MEYNYISINCITDRSSAYTDGEDFSSVTNGELTFKELSTACATITIQNDELFENDETFTFSFSANPLQPTVSVDTATVTVTIQDDDGKILFVCDYLCYCTRVLSGKCLITSLVVSVCTTSVKHKYSYSSQCGIDP